MSQAKTPASAGQRQLQWGGARRGAGRPRALRRSVAHARRPAHSAHHPVHVTLRMAKHVWNLRSERGYRVARSAFERTNLRGLVSITHYSVQGNHVHLIVESRDRRTLAAGIKGLEVRLARRLNTLMGRGGRAFGDRYHARALSSPRAVHRVLAYVLLNRARHFPEWAGFVDPYSSAGVFDGWAAPPRPTWAAGPAPPPIAQPTTPLLLTGWRALGPIDPTVVPGPPRVRS